jgi:hypothetical protein
MKKMRALIGRQPAPFIATVGASGDVRLLVP